MNEEIFDDAIAWQELAEKLTKIYKGEFSYSEILECVYAARIRYNNLLISKKQLNKKEELK